VFCLFSDTVTVFSQDRKCNSIIHTD
jgi:hypothetical protein